MKAFLVALLLIGTACTTYPPPEWPAPHEEELWVDAQGTPLVLHKAPILVYAHADVAIQAQNAVDTWNMWLSFDLLRFTMDKEKADIRVGSLEPNPAYAGITGANGQLRVILLASKRPAVAVHEFGHALGLGHDPDNINSIMYPSAQDAVLPWIEAGDLVVLRKHYAPLYNVRSN